MAGQIFRGIRRLVTLRGAAKKSARHVHAEDLSLIDDAAIVCVNGIIEWLGRENELPGVYKKPDLVNVMSEIDLGGCIVIPGLVECHTHLVYAGNRAAEFERRNLGESYQAIAQSGGGILSTVRATREASEDELVESAQKRVDRFVQQGVTTVEVKSGYGLTLEDELKMLRAAGRLRNARVVRTFLGAHAVPKDFANASDYVEHLISDLLPKVKAVHAAERVDVFVENGYFEKDVARCFVRAAQALGFAVTMHADQLTRAGGAELAIEVGACSADHLVQINSQDVARLAASEVTCVLLPSADLYVNCPYPPARALIEKGARVAIATDFNPGTAPSQDVALVGVLARIQMKMTFAETLVAYTLGSAYALGLEREIGSLEIGKRGDFAVLEGELEEIFLQIGRMPVLKVYRNGERVEVDE